MAKKVHPFYAKMLKAKEAKKAMVKKEKVKKQEEFLQPPKQRADKLGHLPKAKRIEATAPTSAPNQNLHAKTSSAMADALNRIIEQSQGL